MANLESFNPREKFPNFISFLEEKVNITLGEPFEPSNPRNWPFREGGIELRIKLNNRSIGRLYFRPDNPSKEYFYQYLGKMPGIPLHEMWNKRLGKMPKKIMLLYKQPYDPGRKGERVDKWYGIPFP